MKIGSVLNDHVRGLVGILHGRRMYEVMRYWDEDRPEWGAVEHDFAAVWRAKPKWVTSRSLKWVGANATPRASYDTSMAANTRRVLCDSTASERHRRQQEAPIGMIPVGFVGTAAPPRERARVHAERRLE
jgi:hypothetical protein